MWKWIHNAHEPRQLTDSAYGEALPRTRMRATVIGTTVLLLTAVAAFSAAELNRSATEGGRMDTMPGTRSIGIDVAPQGTRGRWHPPHTVKVWTTRHKGRIFRVTQLPRCRHIEALIAYNPRGETLKQAKARLGGVAALSGSFHHPRTFALADFMQRDGSVYTEPTTGRSFLAMYDSGRLSISRDYDSVKGRPEVSALALGQRLVPLERDGFSTAFMNEVTDRMAIGLNNHFIFVVQGKSDIWKLAQFMSSKLPVTKAVNSDGGHVVRGIAPVHVVFRWKTAEAPVAVLPIH